MDQNFLRLNEARRRSGRTVTEFCRAAGVPVSTWWRAATGKQRRWYAPTLRKLERAARLDAAPVVAKEKLNIGLIRSTYRGHVIAIAKELGADAEEVLASDPARRAVHDPKWALAARVRMLAIYCTTVGLGIPYAVLARAIGVTKQAVSWNVARARDLEDDPKFGPIMDAASRLVTARPAGAELGAIWED